jgi:GNAT superfamily N-acetyltransferase
MGSDRAPGGRATQIARLDAAGLAGCTDQLAELLVDAVEHGASVGFLAGLDPGRAASWWQGLTADVASGVVTVWVARDHGQVIGTVQLRRESKQNGAHRAELAKLVVHSGARRTGVGRALLARAEGEAAAAGVRLLLLDTQTGSAAEHLYRACGWNVLGVVPGHAADPGGTLRPTTFMFKELPPAPAGPARREQWAP